MTLTEVAAGWREAVRDLTHGAANYVFRDAVARVLESFEGDPEFALPERVRERIEGLRDHGLAWGHDPATIDHMIRLLEELLEGK